MDITEHLFLQENPGHLGIVLLPCICEKAQSSVRLGGKTYMYRLEGFAQMSLDHISRILVIVLLDLDRKARLTHGQTVAREGGDGGGTPLTVNPVREEPVYGAKMSGDG